ncbi:MAG: FAD:protein FMN transferase [Planctomycetota bacterium]
MSESRPAVVIPGSVCVAARSAMRTRFEVVIGACDAPRADWDAIAEETLDLAEDWHARLTRFEPGSPVWLINERAGSDAATPVDGLMIELLSSCARLVHATGGAFDPTRAGEMDALEVDADAMTARLKRPGVSLDFGAAGKGAALDDMARTLRSLGVTSALLHGGTSGVIAIGSAPGEPEDADGWGVCAGGRAVRLRDEALGVSAPAAGDAAGTSHLIDPATGKRVSRAAPPAALICERALDADAWSTALAVDPGLLVPAGVCQIEIEQSLSQAAREA